MPITVRCACGQALHADERHAGRTARCRCGRTLTIPAALRPKAPPRQGKRAARRGSSLPGRLRAARARLLAALSRPRPPLHWSERAAWGYLALALLTAAALPTLGDRWWPVTVFLFGPRWVLLLPLIALVPIALRWQPRALAPLALGALVVLGPVMGWHLGWRGLIGGRRDLRVVSYNVANGSRIELGPALERWDADVVALQECGGGLANHVRAMASSAPGWHTHVFHDLCLITRYPIVAADTFTGFRYGGGWGGLVARYRLQAGDRPLTVVNLHFDTPRRGLERVRAGGGVGELTTNLRLRSDAMRHARDWLGPMPGPVVVAGDFNTPSESAIFRKHWGDFEDAFEEAGRGYGGTRVLRRYRVRIDHLLSTGGIAPTRAEVGIDLGSDHLPLIADFEWE